MVTGQGIGMGSGGCDKLSSRLNFGYTVSLSVSIRDCSLQWNGSQVTNFIILSTYLLVGAGRPILFVSGFPALSVSTEWRRGKVGGPRTILSPGLR